ncbi:SemiSWEET transporter [Ekhidna sp.]|uniref:SemiSWEET transporter n=1 Tax=Ekhidna sp. TaxID=2608089 RepID=UPI003299E0FE
MEQYIGFIAAFLTTISFAPQALKTIRTKNTEGISLVMYILFTSGIFCWLIYGLYLDDLPIILANSITLILSATILIMKVKYR